MTHLQKLDLEKMAAAMEEVLKMTPEQVQGLFDRIELKSQMINPEPFSYWMEQHRVRDVMMAPDYVGGFKPNWVWKYEYYYSPILTRPDGTRYRNVYTRCIPLRPDERE